MSDDDLIASLSPAAREVLRKLANASEAERRFVAGAMSRALLKAWERIVDSRAAGGLPPGQADETEIERIAVEISRPARGDDGDG